MMPIGPANLRLTEEFGAKILQMCIQAGGTITGEHGVGIEKIDQMCSQFKTGELEMFHAVKAAFDPEGLLNPGKAVPDIAPLRRTWRDARASGRRKIPRAAEILRQLVDSYIPYSSRLSSHQQKPMQHFVDQFADTIRTAAAHNAVIHIRGGGTKDFYGNYQGKGAGQVEMGFLDVPLTRV